MRSDQLAAEIQEIALKESKSHISNLTAIELAQALLEKYDIREKIVLTLDEKREQVRRGDPSLVRYGGKKKDIISLDPPTTDDTKGRTYKL